LLCKRFLDALRTALLLYAACTKARKHQHPKAIVLEHGSATITHVRTCIHANSLMQVGVMDMLRFHKFTIGHAWTTGVWGLGARRRRRAAAHGWAARTRQAGLAAVARSA
jgi:hypothetical protein